MTQTTPPPPPGYVPPAESDSKASAVAPGSNPADSAAASAPIRQRRRIPMSIPLRKLEVPEIPGFHLHWFLESRIPRAIQASYEFVKDQEVPVNQMNVGTSAMISGNSDMGTNVRVIGGPAEGGGMEWLVLMKIPEEFWLDDQKLVEERNVELMSQIFTNEEILGSEKVDPADKKLSYVKTALLNRPTRKAR